VAIFSRQRARTFARALVARRADILLGFSISACSSGRTPSRCRVARHQLVSDEREIVLAGREMYVVAVEIGAGETHAS